MQTALMNYNASDVLHAFYRDAPFLFLGSAFITVALVAAAFSAVRRRVDPLLIYFALFAGLYGLRLWLRASLVRVALRDLAIYQRVVPGIDYLILVPAFLFFCLTRIANACRSPIELHHGWHRRGLGPGHLCFW
jgi:hypothetical protein